ncbi:MAG: hypothetical protein IJ001_07230 [Oscillospiraceae bacterium]|nr:hypothetical protein [Oscillospiraceae bacterium]
MKKISILALTLVLTAAMFTGCGCRNSKPMDTVPTTRPATVPTTEATRETTVPTTHATEPYTDATIDNGNGPLSTDNTDTTNATENGGTAGRSRRMPMG